MTSGVGFGFLMIDLVTFGLSVLLIARLSTATVFLRFLRLLGFLAHLMLLNHFMAVALLPFMITPDIGVQGFILRQAGEGRS
ncbi:hypothetical protein ColTof4_07824 [Colletotrichum tofieldiae]|nr:hypothetical protein ColTof4_07824 [Colletotrichum tofieldiae]GKT83068.1 hypothetical protein Ct61P_00918 [Colletotrichum tofieldiae]